MSNSLYFIYTENGEIDRLLRSEIKKLIPMGKSSLVVLLPKTFTESCHLQRGDSVALIYDSILVIFPGIVDEKLIRSKISKLSKILEDSK